MAFSPRGIGDQSPIHSTFTVDGGAVYPLTGILTSSMAMHFINISNATMRVGTGSWTIISASNGQADYNPSADDVATAGSFRCYPVIQLSTGPKPFDPQTLDIENWT